MSEGLIFKRGGTGGGSKSGVCAIKASWPEGYTCICYSGSKKLKAGKDATEWIFLLPFAGEWTVEAGKLSKTEIVADGEVKEVTLTEDRLIIDNGKLAAGLAINTSTGTYETVGDYMLFKSTVASSGNGKFVIDAAGAIIDFVGIDKIIFDLEATSPRSGMLDYIQVGIEGGTLVQKKLGSASPVARQEIEINVASLTSGRLYMFISDNPATVELKIYSIKGKYSENYAPFYLFKSGEGAKVPLKTFKEDSQCYVDVSSGAISKGWQSNNRVTSFSTEDKIDLTDYSSLVIEYTCSDPGSGNYAEAFGISTVPAQGGASTAILDTSRKTLSSATSKTIATLDISSLNGEYYIGVCGAGKTNVYNWYLV